MLAAEVKKMKSSAAVATGATWRDAFEGVREQMPAIGDAAADLALLFASDAYAPDYDEMLAEVRHVTAARVLIGCSGQGVIGPGREVEGIPALSLAVFSLPGATLEPVRVTQADIDASIGDFTNRETPPNAWIVFADPFTLDTQHLLDVISREFPALPLIGGLSSGDYRRRGTYVFLDGEAHPNGAVALAIGGAYTVRTVVSQGAAPIGETWTITGATENVIETIGMRRAFDVLIETLQALPPELQDRAQRNLLVGLAMDEYKDEFHRGDFLIRNLTGISEERGVIAVGDMPRIGQTLQFQLRDPAAADEDLIELLERAKLELDGEEPVGALLCSCNGRGVGLFGRPDHDARTVREHLGAVPLAGFFCNGEIGPVGGKNFLHGFTASMALFVPAEAKKT
jgi:small ligand-binding sensory domain FIST